MNDKSPNILLVLADQHNAGLLGCAGHRQALTPNLDRFAAGGVRFSNAYAQNTICTPSRVCILSGQYCHNHGIYGLSGPAQPGLDNLMRHARRHGYFTAAFGKLHLPNSPRNWIADDLDHFGDTYETPDGLIGDSEYFRYLENLGLREQEDSWHNPWNYGPGTISSDARPSELPYEHTQEVWCARQAMACMESAATNGNLLHSDCLPEAASSALAERAVLESLCGRPRPARYRPSRTFASAAGASYIISLKP